MQAHPTNAIQRPCTQQRANGGPDDRAGQTQVPRAAVKPASAESLQGMGGTPIEGDGQSHADAAEGDGGFHQVMSHSVMVPIRPPSDVVQMGGVSRECSGKPIENS